MIPLLAVFNEITLTIFTEKENLHIVTKYPIEAIAEWWVGSFHAVHTHLLSLSPEPGVG